MEEMERLKARLDNIQAVEPILSALRTISLGTRTVALKRAESARRFREDLARVVLLIAASRVADPLLGKRRAGTHSVLLVIGTERGLCGTFNESLLASVRQLQPELNVGSAKLHLWVLGSRAVRALRGLGAEPAWSQHLSLTALPPPALAGGLVSGWLKAYETGGLSRVEVAYNAYRGLAPYEPSRMRLLPVELPAAAAGDPTASTIVETDRKGLLRRALALWLSAKLHAILLDAAAAEHTARYQLMDGAAENAERLIEELTLFLQVARQEAITSEMQDLASGAGLLEPLYG